MDELINKLVAEYKADHITWHDIQDQVEAYVLQLDGYGLVLDKDIIHKRVLKENEILQEIENQLKGGE